MADRSPTMAGAGKPGANADPPEPSRPSGPDKGRQEAKGSATIKSDRSSTGRLASDDAGATAHEGRAGSSTQARPTATAPGGAHLVARVRPQARVKIMDAPGGGVVGRVDSETKFGSPTVFGVVRQAGPWAAVMTPELPNGRLGWVRLDPTRMRFGWTRTSIVIDLSDHRAQLYDGPKAIRSFPVTVGAPGSSTPTGRFAVTDTFRGLDSSAYGCCALALSATQPSLPAGWLGGNRIAIHGTDGPLGVAASHGCVRAADHEVSELIDHAPLGAPVLIRR